METTFLVVVLLLITY